MTEDDRAIWRLARQMIEEHCDQALGVVADKADALLLAGQMTEARTWLRVLAIVHDIRGLP